MLSSAQNANAKELLNHRASRDRTIESVSRRRPRQMSHRRWTVPQTLLLFLGDTGKVSPLALRKIAFQKRACEKFWSVSNSESIL
jgi:hypothetical protein